MKIVIVPENETINEQLEIAGHLAYRLEKVSVTFTTVHGETWLVWYAQGHHAQRIVDGKLTGKVMSPDKNQVWGYYQPVDQNPSPAPTPRFSLRVGEKLFECLDGNVSSQDVDYVEFSVDQSSIEAVISEVFYFTAKGGRSFRFRRTL